MTGVGGLHLTKKAVVSGYGRVCERARAQVADHF